MPFFRDMICTCLPNRVNSWLDYIPFAFWTTGHLVGLKPIFALKLVTSFMFCRLLFHQSKVFITGFSQLMGNTSNRLHFNMVQTTVYTVHFHSANISQVLHLIKSINIKTFALISICSQIERKDKVMWSHVNNMTNEEVYLYLSN